MRSHGHTHARIHRHTHAHNPLPQNKIDTAVQKVKKKVISLIKAVKDKDLEVSSQRSRCRIKTKIIDYLTITGCAGALLRTHVQTDS